MPPETPCKFACTHFCVPSQPLLPDILDKAYDGKEGARTTPIVIWGVKLDPNGKKDARASVVLMKWLRARWVIQHAPNSSLTHTRTAQTSERN